MKTPRGKLHIPTNGTRFNVQNFFVEVAENRAGLTGALPAAQLEALKSIPAFEMLSESWIAAEQHSDAGIDPAPVEAER